MLLQTSWCCRFVVTTCATECLFLDVDAFMLPQTSWCGGFEITMCATECSFLYVDAFVLPQTSWCCGFVVTLCATEWFEKCLICPCCLRRLAGDWATTPQTWHKILKNFEKSKFWTYWYWFWYWKLQFQNIDFDIDIEICISKILILILILNFLGILILILVLILKKMVKILKICVVRKTQVPLWPWVLGLIFHSFPPLSFDYVSCVLGSSFPYFLRLSIFFIILGSK